MTTPLSSQAAQDARRILDKAARRILAEKLAGEASKDAAAVSGS